VTANPGVLPDAPFGRRFRLASPSVALLLGLFAVAVTIAAVPVAEIGHKAVFPNVVNPLALVFGPVGLLVAVRRPSNPIGWGLLLGAACSALSRTASLYSIVAYNGHHALPLRWVAVLAQPSWAPEIVLLGLGVQLFPTGSLPPGRWRWVLWSFLAFGAVWVGGAFVIAIAAVVQHTVHVASSGDLVEIDHPTGIAAVWGDVQTLFFPFFGLMLLAWFARELAAYRRSGGDHRQQLKWLAGGTAVAIVGGALSVSLSGRHGILGAVAALAGLAIVAFPISVAIGVLKYRLYEIDRLISRTVSYLIITVMLAGVFIGIVFLATDVLPFSSRVAVAASTLAAAALFNPLRKRVQHLVDRRFNRARYDAEAIVTAFTLRLRDAVDLDTVRGELLLAVNRAVEPTYASVWLRPR
jgi:hypothetical protein